MICQELDTLLTFSKVSLAPRTTTLKTKEIIGEVEVKMVNSVRGILVTAP